MWDCPFDPEAGFEAAARVLCSAQFLEHEQGGGVWTTDVDAEFMRLNSSNCCTLKRRVDARCFASHTTLVLPDNPPLKPCPESMRQTHVHRFTLTDGVAAGINGHLMAVAQRWRSELTGSSRSNVGGYHSVEEVWQDGGCSREWYGGLHNVVLEALRALNADADAGTPGAAPVASGGGGFDTDLHVSGWFNVSAPREFNTLHDHGDALWAAVYYVARGGEGAADDCGESGMETDADDARAAGSLVLKTQLVPFSHTFGYLPIAPRAGDLWIFPGHLSHAVLPRTLQPAGTDATPTPCDGAPRVSVAINVQRKASAADGGSPMDQGVARALRKMYPADPEFRPSAEAQKLD